MVPGGHRHLDTLRAEPGRYFAGTLREFTVPLAPRGTPFQEKVWAEPPAILIPCHRVIGKDGTLTGYGGGLWRKRLLLELERLGRLPG